MISNPHVLEEDFVPREVVHRDAEITMISEALDPLTKGQSPSPLFLYGPSGAGKTCLARYTGTQLANEVTGVRCIYLNCWMNYTRFKALYTILDEIGNAYDIHRQSTPLDELISRVEAHDWENTVIILDEVDQLDEYDVLYTLYTVPNITLILIANTEHQLFVELPERIRSRLQSATRVHLEQYTMAELSEILAQRVKAGFHKDAISPQYIEVIADAAAGDARVALGILKHAAQKASASDSEKITKEHIKGAVSDAHIEIRETHTEKLNPDQRVLYEIIEEHQVIDPAELYAEYQATVDDPKADRTVRKYLNKMAQYSLIEQKGEKRGRQYKINEGTQTTLNIL